MGTAPAPASAPRPQRYGRYVLLEMIGQGGMAEVFRAVARGTQGFARIIVVKRILPELSTDPRFVRMFVDEAKISALISHPNVVQVFEFGKIGETYFLAMEYIHGRNLSAVMGKLAEVGRTPPVDVVAEVVRQAALGLEHAHNMVGRDGKPSNLVHRDVTPSNIMVGYSGAVKLLDFGIARAAAEAREQQPDRVFQGKRAYSAPEQIRGQPLDRRTDVFGLGIVMWECLTGRRLFKADTPEDTVKLILETKIPPPSTFNPAVPKALDRICLRALERDPAARYQQARAMAAELEPYLHESRYASDRLPFVLRELFKEEVTETKERLLDHESAAVAALEEKESADVSEVALVESASTPGPSSLLRRRWLVAAAAVALFAVTVVVVAATGPAPPAAVSPVAAPPTPPPPEPPRPAPEATEVTVSLDSSPQGATVVLAADGRALGETPSRITLPRGQRAVELVFTKDGHHPASVQLIPDHDKPAYARLESLRKPTLAPVRKPPPPPKRGAVPLDPFER